MGIPGPQELALLLLVAVGAFVLRRVIQLQLSEDSRPAGSPPETRTKAGVRAPMRLAIVASFIFVAIAALVLEPWVRDPVSFFAYGVLPVVAAWGVAWVMAGSDKSAG